MGHDDHYIYLDRLTSEKEVDRELYKILSFRDKFDIFYNKHIKPIFIKKKKGLEASELVNAIVSGEGWTK
jgi:hypothetical protein